MTTCDVAQRLASDALDDPIGAEERAALDEHLRTCAACAGFDRDLSAIRRRLRVAPVGEVPDVAAEVRARLTEASRPRSAPPGGSARRWPALGRAAAVLAAAFLAGALVAGLLAPQAGFAGTVGQRMLSSQAAIDTLTAELTVTEHGWHPDVPVRRFAGRMDYAAPDRFVLVVDDHTRYPDGSWRVNDVTVSVAPGRIVREGPAPCPAVAQPTCTPPRPRLEVIDDPEPFTASGVAPLDLVVPTGSFAADEPVTTIEDHPVDGRPTLGVEVTAAQVDGLLGTLLGTGNWRQVHPADRVRLWLDRRWAIPLEVEVVPGTGLERRRWAATHGYQDPAGQPLLHVTLDHVRVNEPVEAAAPSPDRTPDQAVDGRFAERPGDEVDAPVPDRIPAGMRPHVTGVVDGDIHVRTWTDGRAWLKVRATRSWTGNRLFGRLGTVVRRVGADGSTVYTSADGAVVGIHAHGTDVSVTGSLPPDELLEVASSLPVDGRPAPPGWPESAWLTVDEARRRLPGLLLPAPDPAFHAPAHREIDGGVSATVAGSGARAFELVQVRGDGLTPPLDDDVIAVVVRGTTGRFTPATGELEWIEDGSVVVLRSDTLALAELLGVAERLEAAPGANP